MHWIEVGRLRPSGSRSNNLYLFNSQGTEYAVARITQPDYNTGGGFYNRDFFDFNGSVFSLYDFGEDGSCPFDAVGSILHYKCSPNADYSNPTFTNKEGTETVTYAQNSEYFLSETNKISEYTLNEYGTGNFRYLPLEEVGGMSIIKQYLVFFAPDGKSFSLGRRCSDEFSTGYQLYE